MIHLKLFEGFDEPMYQQIDRQDGMDLIETRAVDMSKKISDKIFSFLFKNLRNKYFEIFVKEGDPNENDYVLSSITPGYHFVDITTDKNNIEIVELEDEWFIVRVHGKLDKIQTFTVGSSTFKCDQLDGLLKLLTDINL
jgi:hypothetical protein